MIRHAGAAAELADGDAETRLWLAQRPKGAGPEHDEFHKLAVPSNWVVRARPSQI